MARYIDAEAMIKRLEKWNTSDDKDKALYNFALNRIVEQPTADVVEVVRCKDCMHYKDSCGYSCFHPNQEQGWNSEGGECLNMNPDDFCSYGKKVE